jgi:hypothetical protein
VLNIDLSLATTPLEAVLLIESAAKDGRIWTRRSRFVGASGQPGQVDAMPEGSHK